MGGLPDHSNRTSRELCTDRARLLRDLGLLVAVTLALHLPFVTQAFEIDDVLYLNIARNVSRQPLFPLDLPYVYLGQQVTMWGHTHPPLNSYLIAAVLFFTRGVPSEIILHAVYLFFPVLATVSFYFLARRFVDVPVLATALFASVPALVVMAHSLMTDVPLLALWVSAVALFVHQLDGEEHGTWLEAGTFAAMTAAIFIAYQGLALIPLLALYALLRRRLTLRIVVLLGLPALLLAAWQMAGHFHRGSAYASTLLGYLNSQDAWAPARRIRTAASTLGYLGGTIVFFPFLFAAFGRRSRGLFAVVSLAAGVVGVVASARAAYNYDHAERIFFVLCFAGGFLATLWMVVRGLEEMLRMLRRKGDANGDGDAIFLSLWFVGVLFYSIVISYSGAARYLLPAVPPLVLMLVRATEATFPGSRRKRIFYLGFLSCQLALGLALAHADFEFAGSYRRMARDFAERHLSHGDAFLFSGEWGFHYYLEELGGRAMTGDSAAWPGELVVKSDLCLSQNFATALDRSLVVIERRSLRLSSPLRLLDRRAHAGFWSDGIGMLPFWFSRRPLDQITVYRVGDTYRPPDAGEMRTAPGVSTKSSQPSDDPSRRQVIPRP